MLGSGELLSVLVMPACQVKEVSTRSKVGSQRPVDAMGLTQAFLK